MTATIDLLPSYAELNADKYTIKDVDGHLEFISTTLKYGHKSNRQNCMRRANQWLDIRLELMKRNHASSTGNKTT